MTMPRNSKRMVALAIGTALASATLVGCSAKVAPPASASAAAAEAAIAKGKPSKAVEHAEASVMAAPRDAAGRALLGAAYVESGRFVSAATTLGDAIALGDTSRRTIVTYALAQIAAGQPELALATLDRFQNKLDPADFGLAIALAGRPQQGIQVLGDLLRSGHNDVKVRQNLAYAFALQGDWRSARLMAEQDVPADKLGERLGHWAQMAMPEMFQARVADLLGVAIAQDPGQPVHLALANNPSTEMMVAEAAARVQPEAPRYAMAGELPPAGRVTAPAQAAARPAAPVEPSARPAEPARRFVSREIIQPTHSSVERARNAVAPRVAGAQAASARMAREREETGFVMKPGDYRVQLGAYFSMSDAQAAWKLFQKRHPELEGAEKVISKANVRGKIYYRVAAAGFSRGSALAMCSMVSKGGGGCLAYAANNPLPGTIDSNVRMAAR